MLCLTCLRVVNGLEPRCTKKGPIKCDFGLWIAVEDLQTSDHARPIQPIHITNINFSGERIPCFITSYFGHDHTPLIHYFLCGTICIPMCRGQRPRMRAFICPTSFQGDAPWTAGFFVAQWAKIPNEGRFYRASPIYAIFRCIWM